MKVLLTGANGFVGSHILDLLRARETEVTVLLRRSGNTRFIERHLPHITVQYGSINESESLESCLRDTTHVIHCAGCTKALKREDYFTVNQQGTLNVVEAVNRHKRNIERVIYISSLAASHPALADKPAIEEDLPAPLTDYGRSKLAGEAAVREKCQAPYTILRPSAVYGPRDADFLMLFKAVKAHLVPSFGGGIQPLSLVYVKDLALAAIECLTHPAVIGKTYNLASLEVVTARELAREIASQMDVWALPISMPLPLLWPLCVVQEIISRLTHRPNILSRQKYRELGAPGWVCDPTRLKLDTGFVASASLKSGIAGTLDWYRQEGWL